MALEPLSPLPNPSPTPAGGIVAFDDEPVELPLQRRSVGALMALLVGGLAVAWAGAHFFASSRTASIVVPASPALAQASARAAPANPLAAAAGAPATTASAATGVMTTNGALPGRRIFVDKRTVGQTPASVTVPCGTHVVQIGSSGVPSTIDVPCNGDVNFAGR
jgi:hypothetical protein